MTWLAWIWASAAAACGMLALIHVLLWMSGPRKPVALLPALTAIAASVTAFVEYRLFTSGSTGEYQALVLWENLVIALVLVPMVWFLRAYLGTGRRWLLIAISALWGVGLVVNFVGEGSLTFTRVHSLLTHSTPWGEPFVTATGDVNPWSILPNLASLLFIVFVIDASVQAWKRGLHHQAAVIGGSMAVFILIAGVHTPLVDAGRIPTPYIVSFAFLSIVMAQTWTVVRDAVRASELARQVAHGERRWQNFIDAVHLAALEVDTAGIIRFANPHLVRLSGYRASDLIGRPVGEFVEGTVVGELERRLADAVTVGPRPVSRWSLRRANGEFRTLLWSSVSLRDMDGTITGVLSIGTDVTDQLRAQGELQVAQREMDRLARASMLGELTSTIAHELNQPLAAILSNAQAGRRLLENPAPDLEELAEILDDIIGDDKRAGEVIHGLRAILQSGEIEQEEVDVGHALDEAVRLVRGELETSGVHLDLHLEADLPAITGSSVQIEQVLLNLLLNSVHALQHVDRARRRVRVGVVPVGDRIELTVSDSGRGIPEEILPSIFEPFYTTRQTGVGMGLSISRRIVEAHGGKIMARNLDGLGAEFTCWFPVARREEAASEA